MVHLQNVSKSYKNGVNALNDITIDIKDGEFVYVIGETGSGKSTFIKQSTKDTALPQWKIQKQRFV